MKQPYLFYAISRFGWADGIKRWIRYDVVPFLLLAGARRRWRKWRHRDRRERGHGPAKYAIDRDGDLFLVECPACHDQRVWWDTEKRLFVCRGGAADGHIFWVYTEDGVKRLVDHRRGNLVYFPVVAVWEDATKTYHLGISRDAPWWWSRKEVYRDLRSNGKDGHGHQPYRLVDLRQEAQNELSQP